MKYVILFLLAITSTLATKAQTHPSSEITVQQTDRHGFSCPEGSVVSQVPEDINAGLFCQEGQNQYSILVAANYTTTAPFSSFRFWGFDEGSGCTLDPLEPFDVYIWDGDPSNGGIGVFSGTFSGITTKTDEFAGIFNPIYQIDIDLGELIQQQTGYIGITRKNPKCGKGFAWIADNDGDGQVRRKEANGDWVERTTDLFFCLSHKEPVPITNRPIYLTAILIGAFLFIRARKIMPISW